MEKCVTSGKADNCELPAWLCGTHILRRKEKEHEGEHLSWSWIVLCIVINARPSGFNFSIFVFF